MAHHVGGSAGGAERLGPLRAPEAPGHPCASRHDLPNLRASGSRDTGVARSVEAHVFGDSIHPHPVEAMEPGPAEPADAARVKRPSLERHPRELEWLINSIDGIVWEAVPGSLQFSFVSRQAERLLGYPLEQWYGPTFWVDHLHPDDRAAAITFCLSEIEAGRPHDFEYRMIDARGQVVWLRDLVSLTTDRPPRIHGVMFDITRQKEAEAALRTSYQRVRELAVSLMTAKEAERARIARELHDGINQQLARVSIGLSSLRHDVPAPLDDEVRHAHSIIQQVIEAVRDLSHELHPVVLKHSGLVAALTSHCKELGRRHSLDIALDIDTEVHEVRGEAAVGLFHVAQEALINVVKHAQARAARVELRRVGDTLELAVSDAGVGFQIEEANRSTGLGLISIVERVRTMDGTTEFETEPGKGTRVCVRVPARDMAFAR